MPDGGYSIKFRFDSLKEATEWFRVIRAFEHVPRAAGLRLQELSDVEAPDRDTRLLVADDPGDAHPWIVRPVHEPAKERT